MAILECKHPSENEQRTDGPGPVVHLVAREGKSTVPTDPGLLFTWLLGREEQRTDGPGPVVHLVAREGKSTVPTDPGLLFTWLLGREEQRTDRPGPVAQLVAREGRATYRRTRSKCESYRSFPRSISKICFPSGIVPEHLEEIMVVKVRKRAHSNGMRIGQAHGSCWLQPE
jgi:hypothetical protein